VKTLTKTLLIIYGMSIMGYGMLEVSHGIMHEIKNKFHHHAHDHFHNLSEHSGASFYVTPNSPPDNNDSISAFNSYFLFFECNPLILENLVAESTYESETLEPLTLFYSNPLVPPPLFATAL
jgi:hypothetical protein